MGFFHCSQFFSLYLTLFKDFLFKNLTTFFPLPHLIGTFPKIVLSVFTLELTFATTLHLINGILVIPSPSVLHLLIF